MTHLQASLIRQIADDRLRQAERRRLTRDLRPAEPRRRPRRLLLDLLDA